MKIYIVRHGETDWNGPRRLQGRSDIPLNETGIEEAKITGEALKDVPFAAAFVSPLTRTRQTAELLIRDRHIPVYEDARIIEMCFGVYEGLSVVNPKYLVKDLVYCDVFLNHPDQYEAPEGGETFYEVCARTQDFLNDLAHRQEYAGKCVLVVSHGGAIHGMLNQLCFGGDVSRFWGERHMENCEVAVVETKDGKLTLLEEGKLYY